jgi:hypothetical protein
MLVKVVLLESLGNALAEIAAESVVDTLVDEISESF